MKRFTATLALVCAFSYVGPTFRSGMFPYVGPSFPPSRSALRWTSTLGAVHAAAPDTRLLDAWRTLLGHGRLAFEIGARNRVRGFRPTPPMTLLRLWRNEKRLMRLYPVGQ